MTLRTFVCRTVVCAVAALAWSQPSFADDTTNAASISDATVWAQSMHQVMGGSSPAYPGAAPIRGPAGVYAIVILSGRITAANTAATPTLTADQALTNYFGYLLQNPATSGLLVIAKWQDLEPAEGTYAWNWLNDALAAIKAWNAANPGAPPKTLQLDVTPGFNSPSWLFAELTSCDGLFLSPAQPVSPSCGYTTIFQETESGTPSYMPLPLPWNPTYKSKWQAFLVALNKQIGSVSSLVSIGVGGPTASSTEIILPNTVNNPGTLNLPASAVPPGYSPAPVGVLTAWNSLLANNYGSTSPYLNSDRAFVEEWAAAIDVYGQTFSGITLTLATGRGLPEFPASVGSPLLTPPPALAPDCGTAPTMDCSAEAAIVAYFAGPGVGGANAKETAENGLRAIGINGGPLSGSSVKWLSQSTSAGISVLPGSPAIVSRMLGGLQFGKSFYKQPAYEGCPTVSGTCTPTPTPEQALLASLAAFFAGTSFGYDYGAATTTNGSVTVANAPINYLQIYDTDFLYAAGYSGCTTAQLMAQPATSAEPLSCQVAMTASVVHDSKNMTAQDLLNLASHQMGSTVEAVSVPPPSCVAGTVLRGAFPGDPVCVSLTSHLFTYDDNAATALDYATNYTITAIVPNIPYGICKIPMQYRQASMGDYVCVSAAHACQAAADNARAAGLTPPVCAPPPPPKPGCSGSSCF